MNYLKKGYTTFIRDKYRKKQVNDKYGSLGFDIISYGVLTLMIIIFLIFAYAYFKAK